METELVESVRAAELPRSDVGVAILASYAPIFVQLLMLALSLHISSAGTNHWRNDKYCAPERVLYS